VSASPEMVALVYDYGSMAARAPGVPGIAAKVRAIEKADDARASLLAAIAKLEAARDEATRRLAAVEEAVEAARKRLGKLVDHFEAMGGEEDSSQLAYDLQAISDGLRAAMEKQP